MTRPSLSIRPARAADAEPIAALHVKTWQAAYAGVIEQDYLDAMNPVERAGAWRSTLTDTDLSVTVATAGADLIGFVTHGPSRDVDAPALTGEIGGLYVASIAWGSGAGTALLTHALGALRAAGHERVSLWVFAENARARAFYEKHGFRAHSGPLTHQRHGVMQYRYARQL